MFRLVARQIPRPRGPFHIKPILRYASGAPSHSAVRACCLLSTANYKSEDEARRFFTNNGHIFQTMLKHYKGPKETSFIIAEDYHGSVYVSFRGTYNKGDWVVNGKIWPRVSGSMSAHSGWFSRSLNGPIIYLRQMMKENKQIYVTGHSMGGAVATLVTNLLSDSFDQSNLPLKIRPICITFGAPLVMIGNSAKFYDDQLGTQFHHYINEKDVVPGLLSRLQATLMTSENSDASLLELGAMLVSPELTLETEKSQLEARWKTVANIVGKTVGGYQPMGQYYMMHATSFKILKHPELLTLFQSNSSTAVDALTSHSMETYGKCVDRNFEKFSDPKHEIPKPWPIPKITIDKLEVGIEDHATVIIHGANLHWITSIESVSSLVKCALPKDLPVSTIKDSDSNTIMFSSLPLAPGNFPLNISLKVSTVSSSSVQQIDEIPIKHVFHSELHHNSLHDIMHPVLLLLVFGRDQLHLPHFKKVLDLVVRIFSTLPLEKTFQFNHIIAENLLTRNYCGTVNALKSCWEGRRALKAYGRSIQECQQFEDPKIERKEYWGSILQEIMNLPLDDNQPSTNDKVINIFDILAMGDKYYVDLEHSKSLSSLQHIDNLLFSPLKDLKEVQPILDKIHGQFVSGDEIKIQQKELEAKLRSIAVVCLSLSGLISSTTKDEDGSITKTAIDNLVLPRVVAAGLMGGFYMFTGYIWVLVAAPLLVVAAPKIAASAVEAVEKYYFFPKISSANQLREYLIDQNCDSSKKKYHKASVYRSEKYLKESIGDKITANSSVEKCVQYAKQQKLSPERECGHYIKLSLLSFQLRTELMSLPLVFCSGPSASGKSTLREYMSEKPDKDRFGEKSKHRTCVPTLRYMKGRIPFHFLDTVGAGTNLELDKIFKTTLKVLRYLVVIDVIVVRGGSSNSPAEAPFLAKTSSYRHDNGKVVPMGKSILPGKPTLTCITHADKISDFEEGKSYELISEANTALYKNNRLFDLRTQKENARAPRYWACFPDKDKLKSLEEQFGPDLKLPTEYQDLVMTPLDVKNWIMRQIEELREEATHKLE